LRAYLLRVSTTSPPPCSPQLLYVFVSGFFLFWRFAIALPFFAPHQKIEATKKTKREGKQVPCQKIYCLKFQKKGDAKNERGNKKRRGGKIPPLLFTGQIWKVSIKVLSF
jgi:hypothetical protein